MFKAPLPNVPPVIPPVTNGADQLYVVPVGTTPLVPSAGVTVNPIPLQIVVVIAVIAGIGFTRRVTFFVNDCEQGGVALVIVTPVICKIWLLLDSVRIAELKLVAPDSSAITPVTGV